MKVERAGGPLLSSKPQPLLSGLSDAGKYGASSSKYRPVVTPPVRIGDRDGEETFFVLLPSARFVDVRSGESGRRLGTLTPFVAGERLAGHVLIEDLIVVKLKRFVDNGWEDGGDVKMDGSFNDDASSSSSEGSEISEDQEADEYVILAAVADGTMREWSVSSLLAVFHRMTSHRDDLVAVVHLGENPEGDSSLLSLGAIRPRRVVNFPVGKKFGGDGEKAGGCLHLSAPICVPATGDDEEGGSEGDNEAKGVLLYALVKGDTAAATTGLANAGRKKRKAADDTEDNGEEDAGNEDEDTGGGEHSKVMRISKKTRASLVTVPLFLLRLTLPPYDPSFAPRLSTWKEKKNPKPPLQLFSDESNPAHVVSRFTAIVGKDRKKGNTYINSVPFQIASTCRFNARGPGEQGEQWNSFVIAASHAGFTVHQDPSPFASNDRRSYPPVRFNADPSDPITSLALSPDGNGVAIGLRCGEIEIHTDLIGAVCSYNSSKTEATRKSGMPPPPHPREIVLTRRVHWHAHPVNSLCYLPSAAPGVLADLYSGGEESVLLTWQLARDYNCPASTLPRIAKGGIVHLVCTPDKVLMYCEDNTLLLYRAFNKSLVWRVAGLADGSFSGVAGHSPLTSNAQNKTIMKTDPRTGLPLMTNLTLSPGSIHWFDPHTQTVCSTLEVALYNRASRTDQHDAAMPTPSVTHLSMSCDGNVMITIDQTVTENTSLGRQIKWADDEVLAVFDSIKFWTLVGRATKKVRGDMPYELSAAMPGPHRLKNGVDSLGMTSDGSVACTVSKDEGCFRLWKRSAGDSFSGIQRDAQRRVQPSWSCSYKIANPSGYANKSTPSNGIAFSRDGSVLAVAYGSDVTLWDHRSATFLTVIAPPSAVGVVEGLDRVQFSNSRADWLIVNSKDGISCQSPFSGGQGGWSYDPPDGSASSNTCRVCSVELIPMLGLVSIAVYFAKKGHTYVALLDEMTGQKKTMTTMVKGKVAKENMISWTVRGRVTSICAGSKAGSKVRADELESLRLYVLTHHHELMVLEVENDNAVQEKHIRVAAKKFAAQSTSFPMSFEGAPTLDITRPPPDNKRQRAHSLKTRGWDVASSSLSVSTQFSSVTWGARDESDDDNDRETVNAVKSTTTVPSADLPVLSGAITRALLGRNFAHLGGAFAPSDASWGDTQERGKEYMKGMGY